MINVRKIKDQSDVEQIKALCEKHNLIMPKPTYTLLAENESGVIIGFTNISTTPTIDCFVSESPIASRKLFDTACGGVIATGGDGIQFYTKRDTVIDLYKHLDLTILGNDYTIARKDF